MIAYLKGKLKMRTEGWIILDVNGVGHKIFTNVLAKSDDEIELFIHHHVREDMSDLYGFVSFDEMTFFEQLLTVSGVGPKMALAILTIGPEKIRNAIIKGDATIFTTISGVGNKVAAKIIVELKNKISGLRGDLLPTDGGEDADLVAALEQLGYKKAEITPLLRDMPNDLIGLQAKLTWALKKVKK